MKSMSAKTKKAVLTALEMYFGKPPYDSEYVPHHLTSLVW